MPKDPKPIKRVRRPYSRDGCQECKKRKLKCDESKPVCWHCSRLSKTCVYKKNIRFSASRSFTADSVPSKTLKASTAIATTTKANPSPLPTTTTTSKTDPTPTPNPNTSVLFPPCISQVKSKETESPNPIFSLDPLSLETEVNPIALESPDTAVVEEEIIEEINTNSPSIYSKPSTNLSFLTATFLPQQNTDFTDSDLNNQLITAVDSSFSNEYNDFNDFHDFNDLTTFASPVSPPSMNFPLLPYLPLYNLSHQEEQYLEIFYHRTSYHIMPFSLANSNPIRDSILSMAFENKFLFSAVMAASSRTAYRISKDETDDLASARYLSDTLKSLSLKLSSELDFNSFSFEALLTTVLILCTDHTSSRNLGWRAHLRGAKDLLDRGIEVAKGNGGHSNVDLNSRTMAFCKVWFAALEVIASITSPRGGTIAEGFANHEAFTDIGLFQLQNAGLIKPNGFNLFLGYSTSCLSIFSELSRLLKISRSPLGFDHFHRGNEDIEKLIADIYAAKQISFPEAKYDISKSPVFDELEASLIPAEDVPSLDDADWFCISHKAHCEAAMLAVYTSLLKLPPTSQIVISSLSTLMTLLARIPYKDFRGTMIHWPLLTAGLHATSSLSEKFVHDRLDLLFQNGIWSAEFSKNRVRERYREFAKLNRAAMGHDNYELYELDAVPF